MQSKITMSEKSVLRDFVINPLFPTISILVFSLVVFVINNLISPQNPISATIYIVVMVVLIFWLVLRFWLGYRLKLIEEYKSWMIPLGILTKKPSIIWQVVMKDMDYNLHPCWVEYFRYTANDLGKRFDNLEAELDKLSNPYLLSENRINSITQKLIEFIIDYRNMYTVFIEEMVNPEKIPLKNLYSYSVIEKANDDLDTALNKSKHDFTKIRDEFEKLKGFQRSSFHPFSKPKQ